MLLYLKFLYAHKNSPCSDRTKQNTNYCFKKYFYLSYLKFLCAHKNSPFSDRTKQNTNYCFTPSSRSLHFAIRKSYAHYFGATSCLRYAPHYAKFVKKKRAWLVKDNEIMRRKTQILII